MKIFGLDNKEYKLDLKKNNGRSCSNGHKLARLLLKEVFPFDEAFEEIHVPGCGNNLYLDFFIPSRKIVIEVQGQQHFKPNKFLSGGKTGFKKQVVRDNKKAQWCEQNNLILVLLDDSRTGEWEKQLRGIFSNKLDSKN